MRLEQTLFDLLRYINKIIIIIINKGMTSSPDENVQ